MKKYLALLVLIGLLASCGKEDKSSSPEQGEEIQVDSEEFKKLSLEEQEKIKMDLERRRAEIRRNLREVERYLNIVEREPEFWDRMVNSEKYIAIFKKYLSQYLSWNNKKHAKEELEKMRKSDIKRMKERIASEKEEAKFMRSQNLSEEQKKKFEYIHKTQMDTYNKALQFLETYLKDDFPSK